MKVLNIIHLQNQNKQHFTTMDNIQETPITYTLNLSDGSDTDHISDDEDVNYESDDTIDSKMREKIHDSKVTDVVIKTSCNEMSLVEFNDAFVCNPAFPLLSLFNESGTESDVFGRHLVNNWREHDFPLTNALRQNVRDEISMYEVLVYANIGQNSLFGKIGNIIVMARVYGINIILVDTIRCITQLIRINATDRFVMIMQNRRIMIGNPTTVTTLFPNESVVLVEQHDAMVRRPVRQIFNSYITMYNYKLNWLVCKPFTLPRKFRTLYSEVELELSESYTQRGFGVHTSVLQPAKILSDVPNQLLQRSYYKLNVDIFNKSMDTMHKHLAATSWTRIRNRVETTSYYSLTLNGLFVTNHESYRVNDHSMLASLFAGVPNKLFVVIQEGEAVIIHRVFYTHVNFNKCFDTMITFYLIIHQHNVIRIYGLVTYIERIAQDLLTKLVYDVLDDKVTYVGIEGLAKSASLNGEDFLCDLQKSFNIYREKGDEILLAVTRNQNIKSENKAKALKSGLNMLNRDWMPASTSITYGGKRLDFGVPLCVRDSLAIRYLSRTISPTEENSSGVEHLKTLLQSFSTDCLPKGSFEMYDDNIVKLPCGLKVIATANGMHKHRCTHHLHGLKSHWNTGGFVCLRCERVFNSRIMKELCPCGITSDTIVTQ